MPERDDFSRARRNLRPDTEEEVAAHIERLKELAGMAGVQVTRPEQFDDELDGAHRQLEAMADGSLEVSAIPPPNLPAGSPRGDELYVQLVRSDRQDDDAVAHERPRRLHDEMQGGQNLIFKDMIKNPDAERGGDE